MVRSLRKERIAEVRKPLPYDLRLTTTGSGVGYFAAVPALEASFDQDLAYLRECPMDQFMHNHLLEMVGRLDLETARQILEMAGDRDPVVTVLLYEASLTFPALAPLAAGFQPREIARLLEYTPLNHARWSLLEDRTLHSRWIELFDRNLSQHEPLPSPDDAGLPFPYDPTEPARGASPPVHVGEICGGVARPSGGKAPADPPPGETARRALERLQALGVVAGEETRHTSSLSPHGFLRRWKMERTVENGCLHYSLSGIQTSYGKGPTPDAARASYAMEMAERCSSFASIGPEGVLGTRRKYPLVHDRLSRLREQGRAALDPNELPLEAPYADQALYWMEGEERKGGTTRPVLVPVQCVFLFCNLDEISLFSGLGSTGLASGNSREQARVSALLEDLERHAEATIPYHPRHCFRLESRDPEIADLLADYEKRGIHVRFQDLTTELGIPCYKSFVVGPRGEIVKGTGAHLDGRKALLSALMETPHPYPGGPHATRKSEDLPTRVLEELPDWDRGSWKENLDVLERLLEANGFRAVYVDLTREDLGIPVVKAIVPGMELTADFDRFSRVSRRLFVNYWKDFRRENPARGTDPTR